MRYRNPPPAPIQDLRVEARAERREFGRLLAMVAALVIGVVLALDRIAVWTAPHIPFAWEKQIAATLHIDQMGARVGDAHNVTASRQQAVEAALQQRLDKIARAIDLPPDMTLTAHYADNSTVNAFATLGGHITVFQGLLSKIEYDEELDAVLAHEAGHVQHRDMVRQLSRGLSTAVALSLIGIRSPALNRWLIGDAQRLQQLSHSRDAEREADLTARQAALRLYGHTEGLTRLFQRFASMQAEHGATPEWMAFTQSHPLTQERLDAARAGGNSRVTLTPLDAVYREPGSQRGTKADHGP